MRGIIAPLVAVLVGFSADPVPSEAQDVQGALVPSASQLRAWQLSTDQFDDGFRPTGSPAHEGYIAWLENALRALGVSDVHTEPFTFTRWTPSAWSLSWDEISPGVMGVTGEVEPELVYSWPNPPLVAASLAFARTVPRSASCGPAIVGEGHNFGVVPLVQFLTGPNYLLLGRMPEISTQLTDYDLMRTQVIGFAAMVQALAVAPASELKGHP